MASKSKSKKTSRYSVEELDQILKANPHLKINGEEVLSDQDKPSKTSSSDYFNNKVTDACNRLKLCQAQWDFSDKHLRILLPDCRILNGNDLLAMAQQKPKPFRLMTYKKQCHELIKRTLQTIWIECQNQNLSFPFLDCQEVESIRLSLFRQSPRLSDLDNLFLGFKYLIDGLHETLSVEGFDSFQVLQDDNMDNISEIIPYQAKGDYFLGILLEKIPKKTDVSSVESFVSLRGNDV